MDASLASGGVASGLRLSCATRLPHTHISDTVSLVPLVELVGHSDDRHNARFALASSHDPWWKGMAVTQAWGLYISQARYILLVQEPRTYSRGTLAA